MSQRPYQLLAESFYRFANHADDLASNLDDDDLEKLLRASTTFSDAARELEFASVMVLDDDAADDVRSLSAALDTHLDRITADGADIAALVGVSACAQQLARSLAAGQTDATRSALGEFATVLQIDPRRPTTRSKRVYLADAPFPAREYHAEPAGYKFTENLDYVPIPVGPGGGTASGGEGSGGGGTSGGSGTSGGGEKSAATGDGAPASIRTYAHIAIASSMHIGQEQPLTVGIDPQQQANVTGDALTIAGGYPFEITVTVAAQEFVKRPEETWSNVLHATADVPNPSVTLHVTPISEAPLDAVQSRTIAVLYSMNAHTIGYGSVSVDVQPAETPLKPSDSAAAAAGMTTYPDQPAFDLTIRINQFGDGSELQWTFESPHFHIAPEPVTTTIGKAPDKYAAGLIQGVNAASSPKIAAKSINGNAATIASAMPDAFFAVWKQLHDAIPQKIPTVLILSEDAYVPWELAAVDALFDASAPPLLGAQADVGRWILSPRELPLPPPVQLDLTPMVEVTAVYTSAKTIRLEHAEEEGRELVKRFGATHVDATDVAITDCFHDAQPPATTMHIALHGIYDSNSPVDGLIMVDNVTLTPAVIRGGTAKQTPFVFLNACQVGTGKVVLGQYGGMPAAFVYAKSRGVVAPLWSVDDAAAKDLALRFYDGLNAQQSPAALLRAERKRAADPATFTATSLAYLYYGNPRSRTPPPPVPAPQPSGS